VSQCERRPALDQDEAELNDWLKISQLSLKRLGSCWVTRSKQSSVRGEPQNTVEGVTGNPVLMKISSRAIANRIRREPIKVARPQRRPRMDELRQVLSVGICGLAVLIALGTGAGALDEAEFAARLHAFLAEVQLQHKTTGLARFSVAEIARRYFERDVPIESYTPLFQKHGFRRVDSKPPGERFSSFSKDISCGRWILDYCEVRVAFVHDGREITSVRGDFFDTVY
jgi:hypothetical protein